jgi:hypothetical protein
VSRIGRQHQAGTSREGSGTQRCGRWHTDHQANMAFTGGPMSPQRTSTCTTNVSTDPPATAMLGEGGRATIALVGVHHWHHWLATCRCPRRLRSISRERRQLGSGVTPR